MISEKFQDWCLYDKNGVACCTKKLDLVEGWVNAGYVDQSPYVNYITMFDKSKKHDYWDLLKKNELAMGPAEIYHLDGKKYSGESKTRWNFECPTHHPVPKVAYTVAIILGNS